MDGKRILQYRHAIRLQDQPKSLLVVGAGPIGMELGYFYHAYGSEVTIVEMLDQVLPWKTRMWLPKWRKRSKRRALSSIPVHAPKSFERGQEQCQGHAATLKDDKTESLRWNGC